MEDKFYMTKGINENLDMGMVIFIKTLTSKIGIEQDYLQVFDILEDTLIHTQEVPNYKKEYKLNKKYEETKLFCIRTDEDNKSYWTLMYANEY